ncbi:hypothetical protein TNCV_4162591, partial [Trichonephila clavipes]
RDTDNLEQFHELLTFAKKTKFQFYEIKPKNERPIKVVLKGLPRNFKVEEIQADLEELGFTLKKVNQLIGRRSKQPIPPLGGTAVLKNKRSQIPTLNCATGMAVTDPQKANLLANTIKNNFIENNRLQDNYDQDDRLSPLL